MKVRARLMNAVTAVMLIATSACARPTDGSGVAAGPTGPMEIHSAWTSCRDAAPEATAFPGTEAQRMPFLDDDFAADHAIFCRSGPELRADGGTDLFATEELVDDVTALVAALRLPSEPPGDGACTADMVVVPWFALVDASGRWARPGVPSDACGKPRIEVRDAIAKLTFIRVSAHPLGEIESAGAAKSGCSQQWADMVWVETTQPGRTFATAGADPLAGATQVRLCLYRVPAKEQRTGKPAGDFERGGVLAPTRWLAIASTMRGAGPAAACDTPAGAFALLRRADDNGGEVYVELDGCRRIMTNTYDGPPRLQQADAALVALLRSAL